MATARTLLACVPQPVVGQRTATPTVIVAPTELPNGRIEIALQPTYAPATTTAGPRVTASVTWNGASTRTVRTTATLQMND